MNNAIDNADNINIDIKNDVDNNDANNETIVLKVRDHQNCQYDNLHNQFFI